MQWSHTLSLAAREKQQLIYTQLGGYKCTWTRLFEKPSLKIINIRNKGVSLAQSRNIVVPHTFACHTIKLTTYIDASRVIQMHMDPTFRETQLKNN